jgi:hypothetical protein
MFLIEQCVISSYYGKGALHLVLIKWYEDVNFATAIKKKHDGSILIIKQVQLSRWDIQIPVNLPSYLKQKELNDSAEWGYWTT